MIKVATKKETKKVETKKELKEAFALWKAEAKTGKSYLFGQLKDEKGNVICDLRGWFNTEKKNPNEPDVRIYSRDEEGNQGEEIAALWSNVAASGKQYMSGTTNEKEKLVGFFGEEFETKRPYVRVYYSE